MPPRISAQGSMLTVCQPVARDDSAHSLKKVHKTLMFFEKIY